MNGIRPTKAEKVWLQAIVDHGCCVCKKEGKFTPAQVHHIDGSRKKGCHFKTIPLCYYHHMGDNDDECYTSRHPFKARFEARYGSDYDLLKQLQEILNE